MDYISCYRKEMKIMANYNAKYLTNYFAVTDEMKFKSLISSCQAEAEVEVFEEKQPDGNVKFGFGCLGIIHGATEDGDDCADNINSLYGPLQELLPPDEAIVITEIGNEKLNYFVACCTVITRNDIQCIDARNEAVKLAGTMLNNPDFTTKTDY